MADAVAEEESRHEALLSDALTQYRPRRQQRYSTVNVLLLTWAEDDIGLIDEIDELERVFSEEFRYFVWRYQIPSQRSQVELQLQITSFIKLWGSSEENLIIVFYSGHGGPTRNNLSSECIWSAQLHGGPELDWSIIQPLLLTTACDVIILLDCCFAGQAVRSRITHNVEFLAATDKDQFTPNGKDPERPSFTKILTEQISLTLKEEDAVTIPGLVRRMVPKETGIIKQPFYVPLSPNNTYGSIRLTRWEPVTSPEFGASRKEHMLGQSPPNAIFLRLSLFTPCDTSIRQALQEWLTRNSPSVIEDISVVERVVQDAKAAEALGEHLLTTSNWPSPTVLFQWLPERARSEASVLLRDLEAALHPSQSNQFDGLDSTKVVQNLSNHSMALVNFLQDNMIGLDQAKLSSLQDRIGNSSTELSKRIKMRLSLIREDARVEMSAVNFIDPPEPRQHMRMGRKDGRPVLVEYWYYSDALDSRHAEVDYGRVTKQAARISALLQEEMGESFRVLPGVGCVHEILHEPRLGFIYQVPDDKLAQKPFPLSGLFESVKAVPLDLRARLASCLCQALLNFHSIGWFHKAIKSSNVIVFGGIGETGSNPTSYQMFGFHQPYIIGFDCSRPSEAETWSTNHDSTVERIYLHPDRWVGQATFERFHDLYALGIFLIEVGCWKALHSMDPKRKRFTSLKKPERLRDYLLDEVSKRLEHSAGTGYANATRYCIQKRDWKQFEGWEVQNMIRRNVLQPLLKMYSPWE